MASINIYDPGLIPIIMAGTSGTAGDLVYLSTGSALTLKSNSNAGTENTSAFLGVFVDTVTKGSYVAVQCEGVVQLPKLLTANKIEAGDVVYADGAALDNKVGTVKGGTAIGICVKQSATTDVNVSVQLLPFYITGAGGFHA